MTWATGRNKEFRKARDGGAPQGQYERERWRQTDMEEFQVVDVFSAQLPKKKSVDTL